MDLQRYVQKKRTLIDNYLRQYISEKKKLRECPGKLCEAMSYALMSGGKRIRPILSIASYEAVGGRSRHIIPVASSLELIHTYSLIHDDLPSMDDDDFRRNQPTVHKIYGEGQAILAGDALLTDAFHIISDTKANPGILIKVTGELTKGSGSEGMVGGQSVDLMLEGKKAKKREVLYIHTHKTGALIRASVRIGAIMGGATRAQLNALTEYGEKTGLAFQIIDDILDITGTQEEIGKPVGSDDAKGKNTYPSIFGLDRSQKIAEKLINESLEAIHIFNKKAEPLAEIARYILSRRN